MQQPIEIPDVEYENIDQLHASEPYMRNRERYMQSRGLSEPEYLKEILGKIEEITGPLTSWQRFYAIAAISGRGVEWAQTRGRSHYHIMGLSCTICGRR